MRAVRVWIIYCGNMPLNCWAGLDNNTTHQRVGCTISKWFHQTKNRKTYQTFLLMRFDKQLLAFDVALQIGLFNVEQMEFFWLDPVTKLGTSAVFSQHISAYHSIFLCAYRLRSVVGKKIHWQPFVERNPIGPTFSSTGHLQLTGLQTFYFGTNLTWYLSVNEQQTRLVKPVCYRCVGFAACSIWDVPCTHKAFHTDPNKDIPLST